MIKKKVKRKKEKKNKVYGIQGRRKEKKKQTFFCFYKYFTNTKNRHMLFLFISFEGKRNKTREEYPLPPPEKIGHFLPFPPCNQGPCTSPLFGFLEIAPSLAVHDAFAFVFKSFPPSHDRSLLLPVTPFPCIKCHTNPYTLVLSPDSHRSRSGTSVPDPLRLVRIPFVILHLGTDLCVLFCFQVCPASDDI